jgi:hypothetical protein
MGAYTTIDAKKKEGATKSSKPSPTETESFNKEERFKKGGSCMKKGGKVMSSASKGKKPARAAGGGVFSSAKAGTPRGASPKPY